MALDPSALGYTSPSSSVRWSERDTMLYALSTGAGADDLAFVTENSTDVDLVTSPAMPVAFCQPSADVWDRLGDFDWSGLVHAAQALEIHSPMPTSGAGSITTTVTKMFDKGASAVVTARSEFRTDDAALIATGHSTVFIRGAGGWGGDRGSSAARWEYAEPADRSATTPTLATQALLYRLNGDRNPLHSDPSFARRAGFERPILHGLCTLGIAVMSVARLHPDSTRRLRRFSARFASPCYPGDALSTRMWDVDANTVAFDTLGASDSAVLTHGSATFETSETLGVAPGTAS